MKKTKLQKLRAIGKPARTTQEWRSSVNSQGGRRPASAFGVSSVKQAAGVFGTALAQFIRKKAN